MTACDTAVGGVQFLVTLAAGGVLVAVGCWLWCRWKAELAPSASVTSLEAWSRAVNQHNHDGDAA